MWLSEECLGTEKISWKNKIKFIFQFLLKIKTGIWNSFFNLIMKAKNEKKIKILFYFKTKIECPFRPTDYWSTWQNILLCKGCLVCGIALISSKKIFLGEKSRISFTSFLPFPIFDFQFSYTKRNLKIENNLIFNFRANLENGNLYVREKLEKNKHQL